MNKKTIRDIKLTNKRVLLRVDYNVSLLSGSRVADDTRISQSLPTIRYVLTQKCPLFIVSHLGRPEGRREPKYSLLPVARHLEKLLGNKVNLVREYIDSPELMVKARQAKPGSINMLENIRFYPQEEANEPKFSRQLASLGDVYVNDAFGVDNRAHASTVGVAKWLPAVAGLLLEKEVDTINRVMNNPQRPLVVIIGGAKAETKITIIGRLLKKADTLIVGGGVANTFLKAWGFTVGKSVVNDEMVDLAKQLFWKASQSQTRLLLPVDVVVGNLQKNKIFGTVAADKIQADQQALDIGIKSQAEFGAVVAKAGTIIWNGPMGVFENPKFCQGTDFIYHAVAHNRESLSIVGGGDTLAALKKEDYLKTIDHVYNGGGAMLEFIEKGSLPGIDALLDK